MFVRYVDLAHTSVVSISIIRRRCCLQPSPNLITGLVQNQDLRRVDQAIVQVRDQEGTVVTQGVTNQAGEFSVSVPQEGLFGQRHPRDLSQRICGGEDRHGTTGSSDVDVGPHAGHRARNSIAATRDPVQGLERDVFREPEGYQRSSREGNNNTVAEVLQTVPECGVWGLGANPYPTGPRQSAVPDRWRANSRKG